MNGYKVVINTVCTDSYQEEGVTYGEWSSSHDSTFYSISPCHENKYPDVVSVEDFSVGDDVFVVWAEWSSGDSFGNSEGGSVEPLAVFSKNEDAKNMKIKISAKANGKGYEFIASTGQVYKSGFAPWNGYFESLDEIHIDHAEISA